MAAKSKAIAAPCAMCGGQPRNHDVVREFSNVWESDDGSICGGDTYRICRCRGCEHVIFLHESWDSDCCDPETGTPDPQVKIYPEAAKAERQELEIGDFLPLLVSRIYTETISAYNAGALTLAGGGLRAIVEAICIDQKVKGPTLAKKIDDLVTKKLLAQPQAQLLHEERYIGNAALHEMLPPAKREVEDGLAIVEGLMNTIFVLPHRADRLRRKRLERSKKT